MVVVGGGLALAAAAILLVVLLERGLERNVRADALLRARILAATLESGTSPASLVIPDRHDLLVQVVDEDGTVLRSSSDLKGRAPITDLSGEGVGGRFRLEGNDFVVAGTRAELSNGTSTVLIAASLESIEGSGEVAEDLLIVAVPVLLVVVAVTTWAIVGRALAPVENIRSEVAEISATELHRRVPQPRGEDEIARLARTMNEMLARLEGSRHRQERLVSDASHELRNPIAAIRHHAEVALTHPDSTRVDELAKDVLSEDMRLQHLVEDLLLLARVDEQRLGLEAAPIDLDDIVLEEASRLRKTTKLKIDTTEVRAARSIGDRAALQRVIRNLAENAEQHASSTIRFEVKESAERTIVFVDDDGDGIPPRSRDAVFERFARIDDARDRGQGGAGLGLAIVAEIVTAHGGSASVGEAPLGGARFTVELPHSSA